MLTEIPEVLTVEEAARVLKIGRSLAYEMVREGALPVLRFGRRVLISRRALERLLDEAGQVEKKDGGQDGHPGLQGGRRERDGAHLH